VIANARITQISAPGAADPSGVATRPSPTATDIRCAADHPTARHMVELDRLNVSADAVLFVSKHELPTQPIRNTLLSVKIDGEATATTYTVEHVANRQKAGGLEHWEIFCKTGGAL